MILDTFSNLTDKKVDVIKSELFEILKTNPTKIEIKIFKKKIMSEFRKGQESLDELSEVIEDLKDRLIDKYESLEKIFSEDGLKDLAEEAKNAGDENTAKLLKKAAKKKAEKDSDSGGFWASDMNPGNMICNLLNKFV